MEQPLLPNLNPSFTAPCSSSSSPTDGNSRTAESSPAPPTTLAGLALVLVLGAMSLWANLEAGEGFDITILNAALPDTPAARRFDLLFVSNGKAAEILLNASEFVERILYPNDLYPRKPVRSVTLRLAGRNLSEAAAVGEGDDSQRPGEFVIHVSPSAMADANPGLALGLAVQRAMARIWLWDGRGAAPKWLVDSLVEYLSLPAGFARDAVPVRPSCPCWGEEGEPVGTALFLKYCEERRGGFVARLNRAMRRHWNDIMLDVALGSSSRTLCSAYRSGAGRRGELPAASTRSASGLSQAM